MKVLFRSDSSSSIGIGHIMRDLILAKQFCDDEIYFACLNFHGNIIKQIPYKTFFLNSNEYNEFDTLINNLNPDMIVIDHYEIDFDFEKKLKSNHPNIKLLVFDDTYEKHYCDILLNHNIYANAQKYTSLVPKKCELRCGERYTLIRDEFKQKKITKIQNTKKHHIFLAFGGADTANLNIKTMKLLNLYFKNIHFHIITTHANKNLKQLQKFCFLHKNTSLHININHVSSIMQKCDLAIVTPSGTVQEVLAMNLKFVAIKTAQNQFFMYNYLKQKRYLVLKSFKKTILLQSVKELI